METVAATIYKAQGYYSLRVREGLKRLAPNNNAAVVQLLLAVCRTCPRKNNSCSGAGSISDGEGALRSKNGTTVYGECKLEKKTFQIPVSDVRVLSS